MSVVVDRIMTVWEVLSDFTNITEQQARDICSDFTKVGFPLPPDDLADDHLEMVQGICENMEQTDIREAMLHGQEDIHVDDDEGDPFYYNARINPDQIHMYLIHHKPTQTDPHFHCVICGEQEVTTNGVRLSCSQKTNTNTKPCRSIYCRSCLEPWLTKCVARCPSCRAFCKVVQNIPVQVGQRLGPGNGTTDVRPCTCTCTSSRIVITVKKKEK